MKLINRDLPDDFSLLGYHFELPEDRIAQFPASQRAGSRLMVLDRSRAGVQTGLFKDILSFLPPDCLIVANNSRVVPARLIGRRPGGGKLEFLLLSPLPLLEPAGSSTWRTSEVQGLLKPAKKVKTGSVISFGENLSLKIIEKGAFGQVRGLLQWQGDLLSLLEQCGMLPLPPYIRRPTARPGEAPLPENGAAADVVLRDRERYQTVYARREKTGSVAAPTAGLHFTPELCAALRDSGREWAEITLYVGYGTFSPVRCDDIREHAMHPEYVELSSQTAAAVRKAKAEGRAVIAVGTTSCRALEGISAMQGGDGRALSPFSGWVNHFLYPGQPFTVIDGMITNFHLPGSTLLMLVSALAGRERVLEAYHEAVRRGFRFFSYGDAMLII